MIRSFRSERMRLRRRSMLRGGGTIVGFAVLVTVLARRVRKCVHAARWYS
jgi:hypothetical protein